MKDRDMITNAEGFHFDESVNKAPNLLSQWKGAIYHLNNFRSDDMLEATKQINLFPYRTDVEKQENLAKANAMYNGMAAATTLISTINHKDIMTEATEMPAMRNDAANFLNTLSQVKYELGEQDVEGNNKVLMLLRGLDILQRIFVPQRNINPDNIYQNVVNLFAAMGLNVDQDASLRDDIAIIVKLFGDPKFDPFRVVSNLAFLGYSFDTMKILLTNDKNSYVVDYTLREALNSMDKALDTIQKYPEYNTLSHMAFSDDVETQVLRELEALNILPEGSFRNYKRLSGKEFLTANNALDRIVPDMPQLCQNGTSQSPENQAFINALNRGQTIVVNPNDNNNAIKILDKEGNNMINQNRNGMLDNNPFVQMQQAQQSVGGYNNYNMNNNYGYNGYNNGYQQPGNPVNINVNPLGSPVPNSVNPSALSNINQSPFAQPAYVQPIGMNGTAPNTIAGARPMSIPVQAQASAQPVGYYQQQAQANMNTGYNQPGYNTGYNMSNPYGQQQTPFAQPTMNNSYQNNYQNGYNMNANTGYFDQSRMNTQPMNNGMNYYQTNNLNTRPMGYNNGNSYYTQPQFNNSYAGNMNSSISNMYQTQPSAQPVNNMANPYGQQSAFAQPAYGQGNFNNMNNNGYTSNMTTPMTPSVANVGCATFI